MSEILTSKEYPRLLTSTLEWYSESSSADISSMARELLAHRANAPETPAFAKRPDGAMIHQQGMHWAVNVTYVRQEDAHALYNALSGSLKAPEEAQR